MSDLNTLHGVFKAANTNKPPGVLEYLTGGAKTEKSLLRNRVALDSLDKLSEDFLEPATPVVTPGVPSAFPFLNLPSQEY